MSFDIFEHIYCNHFENEKEEEEEEEDTSTKELYDCIVICKKNLMIGYFDNCIKIAYSNIDKEENRSYQSDLTKTTKRRMRN